MGGQRHARAALPPGTETYSPLHSKPVGPHVSVWMFPGNLAKTGVENPDGPACRVAIPPESSQHQVFITATRKYSVVFFSITFWIQEQNVGKQEAVPSLLSPILRFAIPVV